VGILQLRRIREREQRKTVALESSPEEDNSVSVADDWKVSCYRSLPLRHFSRLWGFVNEIPLPRFLRRLVLSAYARSFGCDLEEAEDSDLENYPSLGHFFRRRLKAGARPVDDGGCLVSPADGRVLYSGRLGFGDRVEQVKGVQYDLQAFLGDRRLEGGVIPVCGKDNSLEDQPARFLYQLVIYLAPGDYHGFHSPCDWTVLCRRHFPGELLSVNPKIARLVTNLFSLNERVSYLGRWKHGFFSMTAVGATNVGSVKVHIDPELCTNTRKWEKDTFHQKEWNNGLQVKMGEYFGEFNLGSTIVLIFEAPDNFEFTLGSEGSLVRVGKLITKVECDQKSEHNLDE